MLNLNEQSMAFALSGTNFLFSLDTLAQHYTSELGGARSIHITRSWFSQVYYLCQLEAPLCCDILALNKKQQPYIMQITHLPCVCWNQTINHSGGSFVWRVILPSKYGTNFRFALDTLAQHFELAKPVLFHPLELMDPGSFTHQNWAVSGLHLIRSKFRQV